MPVIDVVRATEIKEQLNDYQTLLLTLWGEARGLSYPGKFAVGCVIRNRFAVHFRGARSIKQVCLARLQFSCWFEVGGFSNYQALLHSAEIVLNKVIEVWPTTLAQCSVVATNLLAGELDITDGATHYFHESIPEPAWAKPPAVLTLQLGGHLFYRNVK